MKDEAKKQSTYLKIILYLVLPLIILAAVLLILANKNIILFPWLTDNKNPTSDNDLSEDKLYNIVTPDNDFTDVYLYDEPKDLLDLVEISDSYLREFRIISSYGKDYTIEKYTLLKNNESFRVESDSKTVISDGKKLYVSHNHASVTTDLTDDSMYSEVGITPLEKIIRLVDKEDCKVQLSDNKKYIKVVYEEESEGEIYEYTISIENGIVTEERFYLNNLMVRTVLTDYIDIYSKQVSIEDNYIIPAGE